MHWPSRYVTMYQARASLPYVSNDDESAKRPLIRRPADLFTYCCGLAAKRSQFKATTVRAPARSVDPTPDTTLNLRTYGADRLKLNVASLTAERANLSPSSTANPTLGIAHSGVGILLKKEVHTTAIATALAVVATGLVCIALTAHP